MSAEPDAKLVGQYRGAGTLSSPFIVSFEEGDPDNPYEWGNKIKWVYVVIVSMTCLCTAFGSSVYAGGLKSLQEHFGASNILMTLGLSTYVLGFATGPLAWGGLSEWLGRRAIFIGTYIAFVLFSFGCTMSTKSFAALLVCRFGAGMTGSSTLVLSGAQVADMFNAQERALAMSIFSLAPFMGPVLGPIAGGFLGTAAGWRWVLGLETIFGVVMLVTGSFVPETYGPVILRWRAARLAKANPDFVFVSEHDSHSAQQTILHALWLNLSRPFVFLVTESIVGLFSLYTAVIYGILYSLFGSIPVVFQEGRGWSPGIGGLAFLGLGCGQIAASGLVFVLNRQYVRETTKKGPLPPEARLSSCIIGAVALPIGLFWFAWTCQPSVHYLVPIAGTSFFGFGSVMLFLGITNYTVDSYAIFAGSALAANAVLRSILGCVFPLFVVQMYHKLGINWGSTVFAFASLALVPIPFLFLRYGPRIRAKSKYAPGHQEATDTLFRSKDEIAVEALEVDLQRKRTETQEV